jgi:hypothetical protein
MSVGYTFQPGGDGTMIQRRRLPGLDPTSLDAVRVLSLHLPTIFSGRPLSPAELMRPRVGGGVPDSAVSATQRLAGAPSPGGGRSELSQLMDLINTALHSTPHAPGIVAGGSGGIGTSAGTGNEGNYTDRFTGLPTPVQRPASPGPYNPFGSGEHYGSDRVSRGGSSPFA